MLPFSEFVLLPPQPNVNSKSRVKRPTPKLRLWLFAPAKATIRNGNPRNVQNANTDVESLAVADEGAVVVTVTVAVDEVTRLTGLVTEHVE